MGDASKLERCEYLFSEYYNVDFIKYRDFENEIANFNRENFYSSSQFEILKTSDFISISDLDQKYSEWLKTLNTALYLRYFPINNSKAWTEELAEMGYEGYEDHDYVSQKKAEAKLSIISIPDIRGNNKLIITNERSAGVLNPDGDNDPFDRHSEIKTALNNNHNIDIIDVVYTNDSNLERRKRMRQVFSYYEPRDHFHGINYLNNDKALRDGNANREDKENIKEFATQINESLNAGRNVIIHCNLGATRSPTVVIAFLVMFKGMSYEDAFKKVYIERGRIVNISDALDKILVEIESETYGPPSDERWSREKEKWYYS